MNHLFFLPFDHRSGFTEGLLHESYPPNRATEKRVKVLKEMVYKAFLSARAASKNPGEFLLLIDEEFGDAILHDAKRRRIGFAQTVEKSGQDIFSFAYGNAFGRHLDLHKPTYAKVLVRYNVQEKKVNDLQRQRLRRLSRFCKRRGLPLLFELLVTGSGAKERQMAKAMKEVLTAGIVPTVWKVEGFESIGAWRRIKKIVGHAHLVVLGRGGSAKEVERYLRTAAASGVVDGFAVGRTVFFAPLHDYLTGHLSKQSAVERMAKAFTSLVNLFHKKNPL